MEVINMSVAAFGSTFFLIGLLVGLILGYLVQEI
jgi:hypothetical protein